MINTTYLIYLDMQKRSSFQYEIKLMLYRVSYEFHLLVLDAEELNKRN